MSLNGAAKTRKVARQVVENSAPVNGKTADPWHSRPEGGDSEPMTTREVAAYWRCSVRGVWRLVAAGVLRPAYVGGIRRPRFDRAEVKAAWQRALEDRP